jgi:hypothetical protein
LLVAARICRGLCEVYFFRRHSFFPTSCCEEIAGLPIPRNSRSVSESDQVKPPKGHIP